MDLLITYLASNQPSVASLLFVLTLYHSLVRVGVLTCAWSRISRRSPRLTSARSRAASAVDDRIFVFWLTIPSSILESEEINPHPVINSDNKTKTEPIRIRLDNIETFCMNMA